jgi:hypothetical protein
LCVPLINQSQLISIVYLENNLTTSDRSQHYLSVGLADKKDQMRLGKA